MTPTPETNVVGPAAIIRLKINILIVVFIAVFRLVKGVILGGVHVWGRQILNTWVQGGWVFIEILFILTLLSTAPSLTTITLLPKLSSQLLFQTLVRVHRFYR